MKIIMSISELTALVIQKYSLPDSTILEVSENHAAIGEHMMNVFAQNGFLTAQGNIKPEKKIASIKLLREFVRNCGLLQAKLAVEDWHNFLAYVKIHGFPPMGVDDRESIWKNP